MAMYKVSQKKVRIEKIITKIKCFGAKFSHLVIEPVHSGSSNILLVPFLEHIVDIKLSI